MTRNNRYWVLIDSANLYTQRVYITISKNTYIYSATAGSKLQVQVQVHPVPVCVEASRALLYTDGVTELRNENGVEFGTERLLQALDKYNHLPLHNLKKCLAQELHAYSNGKLDHDDVTFIFTEVTEKLPCHSQEAA